MINFILLFQESVENSIFTNTASVVLILLALLVLCYTFFGAIEGFYVDFIAKKPLVRHFYLFTKELTKDEIKILESNFQFYLKLDVKQKKYFRHRVYTFVKSVDFIGKDGVVVDNKMKILIAATAVMLTFGYRNYTINLVNKILIYPKVFYSNLDKNYHKGHFNPSYKAVILSWEDFAHGYKIPDDNLNLGIHEFVHALHLSYLHSKNTNDISAHIFTSNLDTLNSYLESNINYKKNMEVSDYFRSYAFENNFEFIAVVIENFIETPSEFKRLFPEVYMYVKQMLNFQFKGY